MNPQFDRTPGLSLPPPSTELPEYSFNSGNGNQSNQENHLPTPEFAPIANASLPGPINSFTQPVPQQPVPVPVNLVPTPSTTQASSSDDENNDALDREWVIKARNIVERTHTDPFMESSEISKVKADFLKSRYNKDIKLAEENH
jgi:hypothetical protein